MKKKQQDDVSSKVLCIGMIGSLFFGAAIMHLMDASQPEPPVENTVSKTDYDAMYRSFYTEIEGERVRANKFKQDFDALTLKEASEAKDCSTWSATVMAENNILRNQPPKIIKVRNNAALNECLGQLDEARDLLHAAPAKRARQLGE